jgi:hypothetical protein
MILYVAAQGTLEWDHLREIRVTSGKYSGQKATPVWNADCLHSVCEKNSIPIQHHPFHQATGGGLHQFGELFSGELQFSLVVTAEHSIRGEKNTG